MSRGAKLLEGVPLLAYDEHLPLLRRYWRTVFGSLPQSSAALIVPDMRALELATIAGCGVTVLPRCLVKASLRSGALQLLLEPPDPPNKEAAWAFIEYYTTQGSREALTKLGTWPSYLPLLNSGSATISDPFFATPNLYKPFTEVSKRLRVFRYSSDFQKTKDAVAAAQREVLTGNSRVDDALEKATQRLAVQTGRLVAR